MTGARAMRTLVLDWNNLLERGGAMAQEDEAAALFLS